MSDILRQVDEELRQDRLLKIWRRYRVYLIGGLLLIIGSVLGYQVNKSVNQSFYEDEVEKYISTSDLVDFEQTIENLGKIENSNQLLISGISKIKIATVLMENGRTQESKSKLLEIINDGRVDILVTDLAIYFYLMSNLNELPIDEMNTYLTNNKLENSSFKYLFKETLAIKYLLAGNINLSQEKFNQLINDQNTPRDIVIRATKFLDTIK
ncbi:hypothetical protein IDH31_02060 [Pelagibacterales bacterium SAG-MED32]|nr:hypothetical protein [Pelagibacterales bacterium SAG-MED32]|tara:strand:- start:2176 stop:2808 length:633 start_codon:yes stop_codon:yes gene_type:complete